MRILSFLLLVGCTPRSSDIECGPGTHAKGNTCFLDEEQDTGDTSEDSGPDSEGLDTSLSEIPLFVNEFMASNHYSLADERGDFDDWIELYNASAEPIALDGFCITDAFARPCQHVFSGGLVVPSLGWLLLFADAEPFEGANHLSFRLALQGEEIGLFEGSHRSIDKIAYGQQASDWSATRMPDGSSNWVTSTTPTPGRANE